MKYYLIGDAFVHEYTEKEMLAVLAAEGAPASDEFMHQVPSSDTNYWGDKWLLIKGEVVVPKDVEIVTKRVLP